MSEEDHKKVVKLVENLNKELKCLSQMNYSLRKKNNEQNQLIARLQKERDKALADFKLVIGNSTIVNEGMVAELQEELRRSENTRKNQKELIQKTLVCLDKGMTKVERNALILDLMPFGKVNYEVGSKFAIIPESQSNDEKKLIADAAEAVEKVDANELETHVMNVNPKEDNDDAGK